MSLSSYMGFLGATRLRAVKLIAVATKDTLGDRVVMIDSGGLHSDWARSPTFI